MRIDGVSTKSYNNLKTTNFKSISITRTTEECIRKGIKQRKIDPIHWMALVSAMSESPSRFSIIQSKLGGLFSSPEFVVTKHDDLYEPKAATAEGIDNIIPTIENIDMVVAEKGKIYVGLIEHNLLQAVRAKIKNTDSTALDSSLMGNLLLPKSESKH